MKSTNTEIKYANERTKTSPVPIPKTRRTHVLDIVTSLPAGKMVPVAAIPLLQGDSLRSTSVNCRVKMEETADELLNGVTVKMSAYLVPHLAKDRFDGSMDQLLRSYAGEPATTGGSVVDFIETANIGTVEEGHIHYYLGEHVTDATDTNTDFIEAYNLIWNWRAKNRSKNISLRTRLNATVGPAFWNHRQFNNIVSDYDQALIVGSVDLDTIDSRMNVRGVGFANTETGAWDGDMYTTDKEILPVSDAKKANSDVSGGGNDDAVIFARTADGFPDMYTTLPDGSLSISLASIAAARRTEKFAKYRRSYSGFDEDWQIDRLMNGLEIPNQAYKQPILLDTTYGPMGSFTRYSTTAGSLDVKTTNGSGEYQLKLASPTVQTGGTVMIVMEILPDQIFERQKNYWLEASEVSELPQAVRDFLDEEPVTVVTNSHIDTEHSSPNDTFGFMPLNDQWNMTSTRIGGKYFRDNGNANYDSDREKLWIVEPTDPQLTTEWYVSETMNQNPFAYTGQDPFDVQIKGMCSIVGLTQFGGRLLESDGEYDEVKVLQDDSRNQTTDVGEGG